MIKRDALNKVLTEYKRDLPERLKDEKFKWEAVKEFQDNWDISSPDFSEMLERAFAKTSSLLTSHRRFPLGMIKKFAKASQEETRSMFIDLFDESKDVYDRMMAFMKKAVTMHEKYCNGDRNHFQDINAISTYLWLRYPDKYYIYKFYAVRCTAKTVGYEYDFKKGSYAQNVRSFLTFYNELCEELKKDDELIEIVNHQLDSLCYPDKERKTLTIDFGFYLYQKSEDEKNTEYDSTEVIAAEELLEPTNGLEKPALKVNKEEGDKNYWWLNANPKLWKYSNLAVGKTEAFTLYNDNGNRRQIFQNFLDARKGDIVIGYETSPVKKIVAICKVAAQQDGEKIVIEKVEGLTSPIDIKAISENDALSNMEFLSRRLGTLYKLTKEEYNVIMDMIRDENPLSPVKKANFYGKEDFLNDVFMSEEDYTTLCSLIKHKKNMILQGAPGVGKTYAAKKLAYSIMGEIDDDRIEFVQFHQNYTYEDFMMGYKPVENGFDLIPGVFYQFCNKASNYPEKDYFFIIDEINRGNLSKIFGELLMLIEKDYRGTKIKLAYNGTVFTVPDNLYIIGLMNTADRSLAMIDYALRRRFSFFEMKPGFESKGFINYQRSLDDNLFDILIEKVKDLNLAIEKDNSLGKGFCIGHSYFCGIKECNDQLLRQIVYYDILPMLSEYWFDDSDSYKYWENELREIFQ